MALRNYELDQKVTLREVYEKLKEILPEGGGESTHDIDLGDFGFESITCDNVDAGYSPEEIITELLYG